ncbi:hypothetical protein D3C72_1244610 [compost metagenome]
MIVGQHRIQIAQRGAGANHQTIALPAYLPERLDLANSDDQRDILMPLGDFQRQIGPAGQQFGLRMLLIEPRQLIEALRQQTALAVSLQRRCGTHGLQPLQRLWLVVVEAVWLRVIARLLRRRQNRAIAGTAAQVAGQCLLRLFALIARCVFLQAEHRHHETRCTKTAL